jgi:multiple sugar transport system substrate-binding protein
MHREMAGAKAPSVGSSRAPMPSPRLPTNGRLASIFELESAQMFEMPDRLLQKAVVGMLVLLAAALAFGCGSEPERVRRIVYWEKWTDFEGKAIDRVVDAFNAKEREKARSTPGYVPIEVQRVTVSRIEQKLLVASAGGNPPDVAGIYSYLIAAYADKGALVELGPRAAAAGIERGNYIEHYYDLGVYKGKLWGLPTAPASTALHWNKRLFREAGLDPEKPPVTIEELDAYAEKLTKWEVTLPDGSKEIRTGYLPDVPASKKRLIQVGFLPSEPGWWTYAWGYFFGGTLMTPDGEVTIDSADNVRAFEWVASYTKKIGADAVKRFRSGFGNFSSPQNPFLSGKIAMEIQGVWMHNFIEKYAPGMQWGAAPFPVPADHPKLYGRSLAEADMIVIPKGSKHPDEAFEFIRFLSTQEALESLTAGQLKFSPLKEVSPEFWSRHPHPFIRLFRDLPTRPEVIAPPRTGVYNEFLREIGFAVDQIQNLSRSPKEALAEADRRVQAAVDRDRRITARRERLTD